MKRDITRRQFLGTTLVVAGAAGAAGACSTAVRPIAVDARHPADLAKIDKARRHFRDARLARAGLAAPGAAAAEDFAEASAPATATAAATATAEAPGAAPSAPPPATATATATAATAGPPSAPPTEPGAPPTAKLIVDVHCHTFNALDIPIDGFIRSYAQGMGVPALVDGLLAEITGPFQAALVSATPKDGANSIACKDALPTSSSALGVATSGLEALLRTVNFDQPAISEVYESLTALFRTMQTVTQTRETVAARISCTYPEVELFTPALVDFSYWINRDKHAPVLDVEVSPIDQIKAHAEVSRKSMLGMIGETGAVFHPYAAFNPWRYILEGGLLDKDAKQAQKITTTFDRIQDAVRTQGFVGVKLYPPCGFLPYGNAHLHEFQAGFGQQLDDALDVLYTWCEAEDVPILTHASTGNSFFVGSSWRGSPWGWRHALDKHPKLRVCFGHFGHLSGIDGTSDPLSCLAWAEGFLDLMRTYPNVYADISDSDAGSADAGARNDYQVRFLYWLCGKLGKDATFLAQRLLYGSDWWMGVINGIDAGFLQQIQQMVDAGMAPYTKAPAGAQFSSQFWGENALRFLGIYDNDGKLRKDGTAKRLTERYKAIRGSNAELPRWLRGVTPAPAPARDGGASTG